MSLLINYQDKEDLTTSPAAEVNKITASNLNEIKNSVNLFIQCLTSKGNVLTTFDGSIHPLAQMYPSKVQEIPSDYYLRIGTTGNSGSYFLKQSDLPNINDDLNIGTASRVHITCNTSGSNKIVSIPSRVSGRVGAIPDQGQATTQDNIRFSLNGNVTQTKNEPLAINLRMWKIIENLF